MAPANLAWAQDEPLRPASAGARVNQAQKGVVGSISIEDIISQSAVEEQGRVNTFSRGANSGPSLRDSASAALSSNDLLQVLEEAAAAGDPLAMWRLGVMYENGTGVEQDEMRAFSYYSQIANDNADTPPRSVGADIVARSFVKIGDYYRTGLPSAGIQANAKQAKALLVHAASYFGDADAQYRVGLLLLEEGVDQNGLQSARWLSLAAQKGHISAQAVLGDLLFNGSGVNAQPIEGLMWLILAQESVIGTQDEAWISELATRAISIASPDQRLAATQAAVAVRETLAL